MYATYIYQALLCLFQLGLSSSHIRISLIFIGCFLKEGGRGSEESIFPSPFSIPPHWYFLRCFSSFKFCHRQQTVHSRRKNWGMVDGSIEIIYVPWSLLFAGRLNEKEERERKEKNPCILFSCLALCPIVSHSYTTYYIQDTRPNISKFFKASKSAKRWIVFTTKKSILSLWSYEMFGKVPAKSMW